MSDENTSAAVTQVEDPKASWLTDEALVNIRDGVDDYVIDDSEIMAMIGELLHRRKVEAELTAELESHVTRWEFTTDYTDFGTNLKRVLARYAGMFKHVQEARKVITEAEETERYSWGGYTLPDKVKSLYRHMQDKVWRAEREFKHFREDMQVWTRAVGIYAVSVGNAGTHREKDARLRGLVEMVEGAVDNIRESRGRDDNYFGIRVPDVFRSDYPVREYKEQIYRLQAEVERLKAADKDDANEEEYSF